MKNDLPTESEIITLHKKYAPSEELYTAVYTHCLAVWQVAKQIIDSQELKLDRELVKAACLLHDIGTYSLIQPTDPINVGYAGRGVAGEQLLEKEGLPKPLYEAVAHHVGHGFTKEHIEQALLGVLPARDLTPKTIEERLVNYVSKLHSRSNEPQFNSVSSYRTFLKNLGSKYYIEGFEALAKEFGEPDLEPLAKEFAQKLA